MKANFQKMFLCFFVVLGGLAISCDQRKETITIQTRDELAKIAEKPWANYVLANDIDLSDEYWTPIPTLAGSFNGNGHTISGMRIASDNEDVGLFASIGSITIANLTMRDSEIEIKQNNSNLGTLAGRTSYGLKLALTNVHVINTKITCGFNREVPENVGGVIGFVAATANVSQVTNVSNTSNLSCGLIVGGFFGNAMADLTLTNCSNTGSINADRDAGGLIGNHENNLTIENCENSGSVTGVTHSGGLIGNNDAFSRKYKITISNSENRGFITNNGAGFYGYVGGFIGNTSTKVHIYNSINIGNIHAECSYAGGFIGVLNAWFNYHDSKGELIIKNSSNKGNITYDPLYVNHGEFGGFIGSVDHSSVLIENSYNDAIIQGDGHVGGLFGSLSTSSIEETNEQSIIKGSYNIGTVANSDSYTGGLIGSLDTYEMTITDGYNKGSVAGSGSVGGLVGYAHTAITTIQNCYNTGTIARAGGLAGGYHAGGLLGDYTSIDLNIVDSYNSGGIFGFNSEVGGFVGRLFTHNVIIKNGVNNGEIVGGYEIGGFIGALTGKTANIIHSVNNGTLQGIAQIDPFIGRVHMGEEPTEVNISNSVNNGQIILISQIF